jgi:hypothetical protein
VKPAVLTSQIRQIRSKLGALLDEYTWTHAIAYGQAVTGDSSGTGDIAYSDSTSSIALRGGRGAVADGAGGKAIDAERDEPMLSALRKVLLDTERKLERVQADVTSQTISLRKATGSHVTLRRSADGRSMLSRPDLAAAFEAKVRRESRGEGWGEA